VRRETSYLGLTTSSQIWQRLGAVSNFLLIAKAGGSGEAAENTCEAISRAGNLSVPKGVELAIEVDLRLSADGRLVGLHDAGLERTTDGHGPARRLDVQELRRLRAGPSGERVPTLQDVLDAAGDRPLLLDLHDDDVAAATAVCRELARLRGSRRELIWVASEHGRVVDALRRLDPGLRTAATKREAWAKLLLGRVGLTRFAPSGHVWIVPEQHARVRVVTPRFVEQARVLGDAVWVFVVDEIASLARLRDWGVDGCVTTRPGHLATALREQKP
jgi:glycerophosphoryl diester phosphodiesterase